MFYLHLMQAYTLFFISIVIGWTAAYTMRGAYKLDSDRLERLAWRLARKAMKLHISSSQHFHEAAFLRVHQAFERAMREVEEDTR